MPTMDPGVSSLPLAPTSLNDQRMVSSPNACRSKLTPLQKAMRKDPAKALMNVVQAQRPCSITLRCPPQRKWSWSWPGSVQRKPWLVRLGCSRPGESCPASTGAWAPCAVLAGSAAVHSCSAAPSQYQAAAGGCSFPHDGVESPCTLRPNTGRIAGLLRCHAALREAIESPARGSRTATGPVALLQQGGSCLSRPPAPLQLALLKAGPQALRCIERICKQRLLRQRQRHEGCTTCASADRDCFGSSGGAKRVVARVHLREAAYQAAAVL